MGREMPKITIGIPGLRDWVWVGRTGLGTPLGNLEIPQSTAAQVLRQAAYVRWPSTDYPPFSRKTHVEQA